VYNHCSESCAKVLVPFTFLLVPVFQVSYNIALHRSTEMALYELTTWSEARITDESQFFVSCETFHLVDHSLKF